MQNNQLPKSAWLPWTIIAVLAVVAIVTVGIFGAEEDPAPARSAQPTATRRATTPPKAHVSYILRTSANSQPLSVTLTNEGGNTEQHDIRTENGVWRRSFNAEPGQFLYLAAQLKERSGSVTCEIIVNGQVLETATSSGDFVIASCSGQTPR